MIETMNRRVNEEYPIAWIEMEHLGDVDEVKQDLRELSERAVFEITRFETDNSPNSNNGNKVVKAYTDTFEKIPKDKLSIVREWINREVFWAQNVCNAKAKIEGENECKKPTKISKKEGKNNLPEQPDTKERNDETNEKKDQTLPPSSVKRIENLNLQILEELKKIREVLEDSHKKIDKNSEKGNQRDFGESRRKNAY